VKLLGPLPGILQLFTITNLRQRTATAKYGDSVAVYFGFRKPSNQYLIFDARHVKFIHTYT